MFLRGRILFCLFVLVVLLPEYVIGQEKRKATGADAGQRAEALLARMTLEEKTGQMVNIGLMSLCEGEFYGGQDTIRLDSAKLYHLIRDYHIGSVQNMGKYPLTIEEWRYFIGRIQEVALEETRLGIPVIYGIDGVHGANYTVGSTLFPHQIGLAAARNPALAEAAGRITAYEAMASGIPWVYGPNLDVSKQPLWGRISETFGEDTYITQVMGDAYIRGAQGKGLGSPYQAAACPKHFLGYGTPFNGKDRSPAYLPEHILRQYYLPPFVSAIQNGAPSIMLNSGSVNGIPCHIDKHLITDMLKEELGFAGVVISDWADIDNLVDVHRVAKDEKEAIKLSVNAGIDMVMEPYDESFAVLLAELVQEGQVPMARVDDAVRRILAIKMKLGLFEQTMFPVNQYPDFASEAFAEASFLAALESLTLLKNEKDILPLSKATKVLVTGVAANSMNYLNGAWSRTFSGQETAYNDEEKLTVLEALQAKLGKDKVIYAQGTDYEQDVNTAEAVRLAAEADVIVACLGERPATEKPSDIEDLTLPAAQRELVKALAQTGKPVILVLLEGRPRIISDIEPLAGGILMAYYPGNEGGRAIAEALAGDYNPGGKLPYTYPRHTGSLLAYDHLRSEERDVNWGFNAFNPQFEFGFGLSYTTFAYDKLEANPLEMGPEDSLRVSVQVTNTGKRAGMETVQLFLTDKVASVSPPVRQLKRFKKVSLAPGESQTVRFALSAKDLQLVNPANQRIAEAGQFVVAIGKLSREFSLGQDFQD
ncbi:MAG: glycoside hydrolase family 3 C-terminal domain-containing protein [Lewinellaceae bacterium]|nr:glycoside hydrolase family 3 C-terminal domain-containing protein [Phaeodactylibacter sp.]MCB9035525.1 glycoside hydrolase family 3 C-terminal domain-containing protein [Lewinellaceae bacterium]